MWGGEVALLEPRAVCSGDAAYAPGTERTVATRPVMGSTVRVGTIRSTGRRTTGLAATAVSLVVVRPRCGAINNGAAERELLIGGGNLT